MAGNHSAAGYCAEGCYWLCEHRDASAPVGRWVLGPGMDDDSEQSALDECQPNQIAGILSPGDVSTYKFCMECGRAFSDSTEYAREHTRRCQLDENSLVRPGR